MKIIIEAEPKEVSELLLAIQKTQEEKETPIPVFPTRPLTDHDFQDSQFWIPYCKQL